MNSHFDDGFRESFFDCKSDYWILADYREGWIVHERFGVENTFWMVFYGANLILNYHYWTIWSLHPEDNRSVNQSFRSYSLLCVRFFGLKTNLSFFVGLGNSNKNIYLVWQTPSDTFAKKLNWKFVNWNPGDIFIHMITLRTLYSYYTTTLSVVLFYSNFSFNECNSVTALLNHPWSSFFRK